MAYTRDEKTLSRPWGRFQGGAGTRAVEQSLGGIAASI